MRISPGEPLQSLLVRHLTELTREPRTPMARGHVQSRRHIISFIEASGLFVEQPRFERAGFDGFNLSTRPIPDRDELPLIIVGAHYDSVTHSPGADDNGTGVAALLALANDLGQKQKETSAWRCRVQLAAYDLEEYGILGSCIHAQELG